MRQALFLALLLLAALPPAPVRAEEGGSVAAEVNGAKITREQIENERKIRMPQSGAEFSGSESRAMDKILLEQLIDREVLLQEAARLHLLPSKEDVTQTLNQAKESAGGATQFRGELEKLRISEDAFAAGARADLTVKRLLDSEAYKSVSVSPDEVQKEYERRKSSLQAPVEIRARDIFFRLDPGADEQAVRTTAEQVLAEATRDPHQFPDLARKYSQGPAQKKGGDLGFFTRNQMPAEFSDVAFSLKPGELSPVIKVQSGFHIILVEARRGGETPPFDSVRASLEKELLRQKKEEALEAYLTGLRKKAKIVVYSQ